MHNNTTGRPIILKALWKTAPTSVIICHDINSLVQDSGNSSALALELPLSYTKQFR